MQFLTEDEMILRKEYFRQSGVPITSEKGKRPQAKDLIQVCDETCEIILSRMNLLYNYAEITDPSVYASIVNDLRDVIDPGKKEST